jgi:hypothetical protein
MLIKTAGSGQLHTVVGRSAHHLKNIQLCGAQAPKAATNQIANLRTRQFSKGAKRTNIRSSSKETAKLMIAPIACVITSGVVRNIPAAKPVTIAGNNNLLIGVLII